MSAPAYIVPTAGLHVVIKGKDAVLTCDLLNADETAPTVTAVSAQLRKDGVAVGAAVVGSWASSTASATIPAATTSALTLDGGQWSVLWGLTIAGVVVEVERPAVLELREVYPPLTITALKAEYPDLASPLGASDAELIADRAECWDDFRQDLYKRRVHLHRLKSLDQVEQALSLLTASHRYGKAGMAASDNGWKATGVELYQRYEVLLDRAWVYDDDQDDVPDTKPAPQSAHDFFALGVRLS